MARKFAFLKFSIYYSRPISLFSKRDNMGAFGRLDHIIFLLFYYGTETRKKI